VARSGSRRATLIAALLAVGVVSGAGCSESGGHRYTAVNLSRFGFYVDLDTDRHIAVVLPGKSTAVLSESATPLADGWRLIVRNTLCEIVGTVALDRPTGNLFISESGAVAVGNESAFSSPPPGIKAVSRLEPATCG
jgi:hypothetical protein